MQNNLPIFLFTIPKAIVHFFLKWPLFLMQQEDKYQEFFADLMSHVQAECFIRLPVSNRLITVIFIQNQKNNSNFVPIKF